MKSLFTFLFCVAIGLVSVQGQYIDLNEVSVSPTIAEESTLVILGKTNINEFKCTYDGEFYKERRIRFKKQRTNNTVKLKGLELEIDVARVDCKKKIYNNNMYELLEADRYPTIAIDVLKLTAFDDPAQDEIPVLGYFDVLVTIAGVTKEGRINLSILEKTEHSLHIAGDINLKMTDYNLEPPSKMGGMVKVKEDLLVRVELIFLQ